MDYIENEMLQYLDKFSIDNNIYNNYTNIVIITSLPNILNENNKNVGRVLLIHNIKKDLKLMDLVEFNVDKSKSISSKFNKRNELFYILAPKWVRVYQQDIKLSVPIKIQKSKEVNGIREYWFATEMSKPLTFKQFMLRRMIETFGDTSWRIIKGYYNHIDILRNNNDYFRALNSTCKHYWIEHDKMREDIIPQINNKVKKFKKEWKDIELKELKRKNTSTNLNDFIKNTNKNVIQFKEKEDFRKVRS